MPDTDSFDFFVSYATKDNPAENPRITNFVEGILAEHRQFSGGRELTYFFVESTLHHGIAESRVFLAFISQLFRQRMVP